MVDAWHSWKRQSVGMIESMEFIIAIKSMVNACHSWKRWSIGMMESMVAMKSMEMMKNRNKIQCRWKYGIIFPSFMASMEIIDEFPSHSYIQH
jgi:hypothetical protein